MYTLKLTLSLLHPGPFQLITLTSNVLMTYTSTMLITSMVYMIDNIVTLNLLILIFN